MTSLDATLRGFSDCGCCEGVTIYTPVPVDNRPGLSALARRVGTHARFKATMLARLSGKDLPSSTDGVLSPTEQGLTTRADDDFSIALLDAWAAVADVLAFYSERIGNEAYLRTATERLSVQHLGRLIGYELQPGVAASTSLAFTLDDTADEVEIEAGTRVQSLPSGGELPQSFETVEAITARAEWNAMQPRLAWPQSIRTDMTCLIVEGIATNVKAGDKLLIRSGGSRALKTAVRVVTDAETETTRIELSTSPATSAETVSLKSGTFTLDPVSLTDQAVRDRVLKCTWQAGDLVAFVAAQGWDMAALKASVATLRAESASGSTTGVYVFRQRAAPFGYNAPYWNALPSDQKTGKYASSWEGRTLAQEAANKGYLYLDSTYPGIVPGSWVALTSPSVSGPAIYEVEENSEVVRNDYMLSGKVSRLTLKNPSGLGLFTIRNTVILAQSDPLTPAEVPYQETIALKSVLLDGFYPELQKGQTVILTGECLDPAGVEVSEACTLAEVVLEGGYTRLTFEDPLEHSYVGKTVTVNANVAPATHGESKQEILGSGDGSQTNQRFSLSYSPLTHISAATATGRQSTLQIRVDDILWHEVADFTASGPLDRVYITRMDDEERTGVIFGDGEHGARLPTGTENVQATYRAGLGELGNLDAGRLTLLARRPQGVRGVSNPIASSGGADAEDRDEARSNAPLRILTLDRVVSLRDYEDFARAFAGVAKALATWTWFGETRGVFLTVAGPDGASIEEDSSTYTSLLEAVRKAGNPFVPVRLASYRPVYFQVEAKISVDPDCDADSVLADVEQELRDAFSFDARAFGQGVARSEVIAVMQNVDGVLAVDLDSLRRTDGQPHLRAAVPQPTRAGSVQAAELLTLDPRPVKLGVMP